METIFDLITFSKLRPGYASTITLWDSISKIPGFGDMRSRESRVRSFPTIDSV